MMKVSVEGFGIANSEAAYSLRDFMQRSGIAFVWTSLRNDEEARRLAGVEGLGDERLPLLKLSDGGSLHNPSVDQLVEALNWNESAVFGRYDLAIIGAGPAGLSAAVYAASEGLRTVVVERSAVGGQAASSSRIENYVGFPQGISGWELMSRTREQAERFGAQFIICDTPVEESVKPLEPDHIRLASGRVFGARSVVIATGVAYTRLNLARESEFLNRGLYYGAGASEAGLSRTDVVVVGGGNSAGQAALNFALSADKVTMIVRGPTLKQTLSSYLTSRIEASQNIQVLVSTELCSLEGNTSLAGVCVRSTATGAIKTIRTERCFVCVGGKPQTDWARSQRMVTDEAGYLMTGADIPRSLLPRQFWKNRRPSHLETSRPGVFAVGDVRHGSVKRCATAVGEGASCVALVHQFLEQIGSWEALPSSDGKLSL